MSIITSDQIHNLVSLFKTRKVNFFHACQFKDFMTYIKLGGIPSRRTLELSGLTYTDFDTDAVDHNNGVWPKVFGNLADFGIGFSRGQWAVGRAPVPNPYGPILFVFHPEAFLQADDLAICLRSAGGHNFDRSAESLSTIDEINRLFIYPPDHQDIKVRHYIKYKQELKKEFDYKYQNTFEAPITYNPEVSIILNLNRFSVFNSE